MVKIISVLGSTTCSDEIYNYSKKLGQKLIDAGFFVATGGKTGVMEGVLEGAQNSDSYTKGRTLAVLPDYNFEKANDYSDIVIPTGIGYARNTILVSMAHAVIAISGGAGTLSEIAFASQLKKPIILTSKFDGWSKILSKKQFLDHRKVPLMQASNVDETIALLKKTTKKLTGRNVEW